MVWLPTLLYKSPLSSAGSDYEGASGQLVFVQNGETEMEIPITIISDAQPEPQENLNVMFSFVDIELPPDVPAPQVDPATVTIVDHLPGMVV